jgi:hypothetical protein
MKITSDGGRRRASVPLGDGVLRFHDDDRIDLAAQWRHVHADLIVDGRDEVERALAMIPAALRALDALRRSDANLTEPLPEPHPLPAIDLDADIARQTPTRLHTSTLVSASNAPGAASV